jgi:hypothetical protein
MNACMLMRIPAQTTARHHVRELGCRKEHLVDVDSASDVAVGSRLRPDLQAATTHVQHAATHGFSDDMVSKALNIQPLGDKCLFKHTS